jgi:hypothetical protein
MDLTYAVGVGVVRHEAVSSIHVAPNESRVAYGYFDGALFAADAVAEAPHVGFDYRLVAVAFVGCLNQVVGWG